MEAYFNILREAHRCPCEEPLEAAAESRDAEIEETKEVIDSGGKPEIDDV